MERKNDNALGLFETDPVRIFGCHDCAILLMCSPDHKGAICPNCQQALEVYADYKYVMFQVDLAARSEILDFDNPVKARLIK
jgi:hypothetical protein